jgi:GNAT superfamily N-acetyltransferase
MGIPETLPPDRSAVTSHAPAPVASPSWSWVPIRSLGPRHRDRIGAHLLSLEVRDRYLRFGYAASDAQIGKYVDMLDFEQDEVFGIFSRRLELLAMAHLAHSVVAAERGAAATSEFGVSVLPKTRGRGFGRRLFEHAMLHARNRGVSRLLIHALSENTAMLKIARRAGASVLRAGAEAEAVLELPPDTLASHLGELVENRAAEINYQFKRGARQLGGLMGTKPKADRVAEE